MTAGRYQLKPILRTALAPRGAEGPDKLREQFLVEVGGQVGGHEVEGIDRFHRTLVAAVAGHRVVDVGDGRDAPEQVDVLWFERTRVAVPAEALVVLTSGTVYREC